MMEQGEDVKRGGGEGTYNYVDRHLAMPQERLIHLSRIRSSIPLSFPLTSFPQLPQHPDLVPLLQVRPEERLDLGVHAPDTISYDSRSSRL
jgi:hypothetical protein